MIRRSTLVFVILFLLLLAGAFFLRKNPLPSSKTPTPIPTQQAKLLPNITAQDITSLSLTQSEGLAVEVTQDGQGGWMFAGEPGRTIAAPGKIEQARDELASTLVTAELPEGYDLSAVGLEKPLSEIRIKTTSGQAFSIHVGEKTPTVGGLYVQLGDSTPVVINKAVIETVTKLLEEATAQAESTAVPSETIVP